MEYIGLNELRGPLAVLGKIEDASYEEIVEIAVKEPTGTRIRLGRIIELGEDFTIVQVFESTDGMSLRNTVTRLTGRPMMLPVSEELLGRTFDGVGRPIDGLGAIYAAQRVDVNGNALNPIAREYPRRYIETGMSAIDGMVTLIRGQKLPIFSGSGLPHDIMAAQIVGGARIADTAADDESAKFAICFAAMGVTADVADFFRSHFLESGAISHVCMFMNLAGDPIVERIIAPRCALAAAEYLAFERGMQVLVIMTDMTNYCEALRELSASLDEIPSRKGYPGYLYSDLASLYERAGIVKGTGGSITQLPILSMPNDDITHPIPDLTAYITEGQIVLNRGLHQQGVYPPIGVLESLSRLMKDSIGEGYTHKDHPDIANQLFASYSTVQDVRALAGVIGEDDLTDTDKAYMKFGKAFEEEFVGQGKSDYRNVEATLNVARRLLRILPVTELTRMKPETVKNL